MPTIEPGTGLLHALRNQSLSWKDVLGELIDNSLDAGAKSVEIRFGRKSVRVIDDGQGCADVVSMLRLGVHTPQSTTKLGRYGVGLKDAACWLWGSVDIETTRDGTLRKLHVNWPLLSKAPSWEIQEPGTFPPGGKVGTDLLFREIVRTPPAFDDIATQIGFTFAPALKHAIRIVFSFDGRRKPIVCRPYETPPLDCIVEDDFTVDGRSVRLRAGIVRQGHANPRPGFAYFHEHRIITCSSLGAGNYGTARVAGLVELDRRWTLSKNKSEIVVGSDELGAAIFERCRGMLEAAGSLAQDLLLQELTDKVNQRLQSALSRTRRRRETRQTSERPETGSVVPMRTGRRRSSAKRSRVGAGSIFAGDLSKLSIQFTNEGPGSLGRADVSGNRINLNEDNRLIAQLKSTRNEDGILLVALGLLAAEQVSQDESSRFPVMRDFSNVSEAWSALLDRVVTHDDPKLKEEAR